MDNSRQRKNYFMFFAKSAVSIFLLFLLLRNGEIEFSKVFRFFETPLVLLHFLLTWLFALFFSSMRWRFLLQLVGVNLSIQEVVKITHTSFFFNSALPGSIGGDVAKAWYATDRLSNTRMTVLTLLCDRLIGLAALATVLLVSGIVTAHNSTILLSAIDWLKSNIFFLIAIPLALVALAMMGYMFRRMTILEWIKKVEVFKLGQQYLPTIIPFLSKNAFPLSGFFIGSMLMQASNISLYCVVTYMLTGAQADIFQLFFLTSIGLLATAIPLLPGGFGVGHFAFSKLYLSIGIADGANVFNIVFLINAILNTTGLYSFLLRSRSKPNSTASIGHSDGRTAKVME